MPISTLINAVSPELSLSGRHLPCAEILELHKSHQKIRRITPRQLKALQSLAMQFRFAKHINPQMGSRDEPAGIQRTQRLRSSERPITMVCGEISPFLPGIETTNRNLSIQSIDIDALYGVRDFLADVPDALVQSIIEWSPPLVTYHKKKKVFLAIANQIPLLLLQHRAPEKQIRVWLKKTHPKTLLSIKELSLGVEEHFSTLIARYDEAILRSARTAQEAAALTGLSVPGCYKKRNKQGVLQI